MDFTALWHWPQWVVVVLLLLRFAIHSFNHGEEMLETTGERKGKPKRYNGFAALTALAIWVSVLICGGFFA